MLRTLIKYCPSVCRRRPRERGVMKYRTQSWRPSFYFFVLLLSLSFIIIILFRRTTCVPPSSRGRDTRATKETRRDSILRAPAIWLLGRPRTRAPRVPPEFAPHDTAYLYIVHTLYTYYHNALLYSMRQRSRRRIVPSSWLVVTVFFFFHISVIYTPAE